jgi:hypothetical protein
MADEVKVVDSIQSDTTEKEVTNPEGGVTETADLEKRIQSAVDKTASKIKKEYEAKLAEANSELSKIKKSQMTDEQKHEAEKKELEDRANALAERERKLTVIEALADVGLPPDFANRISGKDEDEIKADAKTLKKFLDTKAHELSEAEIAKRLKGEPPKGGQNSTDKIMTRESFQKLDPQAKVDYIIAGGKLTD